MIPTVILAVWLLGLLALGLVSAGGYLLYRWYELAHRYDPTTGREVFNPDLGLNGETALLAAGLLLLLWTLLGRLIVGAMLRMKAHGHEAPRHDRAPAMRRVRTEDGTDLHVEETGPNDAPIVVLCHGWGADSTEWHYHRHDLGRTCRLVMWDLPGLGRSAEPPDKDYSMEHLARCLDAVLRDIGQPAYVVGHSIGGMIALTHAKLFPEALGNRVLGLGLVHTTYMNPVRTTKKARINTALEKPVLVPLLHLTIALSPLVRGLLWLSYLNGTAHLQNLRSGFGGTQTWGEVDFVARYNLKVKPAVIARGMFGMLRYEARDVLPHLNVPTLVVAGDRDPTCVPEASRYMAQVAPGAYLRELGPAKHYGLIEHHEAFSKALLELAAPGRSA